MLAVKRKQERAEELEAARKKLLHVTSTILSKNDDKDDEDAPRIPPPAAAARSTDAMDLFSLLPPPNNASGRPPTAGGLKSSPATRITTKPDSSIKSNHANRIASSLIPPSLVRRTKKTANDNFTMQKVASSDYSPPTATDADDLVESSVIEPYPDTAGNTATAAEYSADYYADYYNYYYQQQQQANNNASQLTTEPTLDAQAIKQLGGINSRADLERVQIKTVSAEEKMQLNDTERFLLGEELERRERGIPTGYGHSDNMSRKHNLQWLLHFSRLNEHYLGEQNASRASSKGQARKKYGF
jgi:hypothetical protein